MELLIALGAGALLLLVSKVIRRSPEVADGLDPLPDGAVGYLSTTVLAELANPRRLNTIRNTDRGQSQYAVVSTRAEGGDLGIFTICVDTKGILALKDGHHRLLWALDHDVEWVPVALRQSKGIRSHGAHIADVLPLLLRQPAENPTGDRS